MSTKQSEVCSQLEHSAGLVCDLVVHALCSSLPAMLTQQQRAEHLWTKAVCKSAGHSRSRTVRRGTGTPKQKHLSALSFPSGRLLPWNKRGWTCWTSTMQVNGYLSCQSCPWKRLNSCRYSHSLSYTNAHTSAHSMFGARVFVVDYQNRLTEIHNNNLGRQSSSNTGF